MKIVSLALILASSVALCDSKKKNTFTQIITQQEYDGEGNILVEHTKNVGKNGSIQALDGIEFSSSFELHAINQQTNVSTFIDRELVSAYLPRATMEIISEDPTTGPDGIARTQAGRQYSVKYTISGLITDDPEADEAARLVNYNTTSKPSTGEATTTGVTISTNGPASEEVHPPKSKITIKATHAIVPHESFDSELKPLASKSIHIWPITEGSIEGIVNGETLKSIPTLTLKVTKPYPQSIRFLRVENKTTNKSYDFTASVYPLEVPSDVVSTMLARDLNSHEAFDQDGPFTISLMYKSIFEEEAFSLYDVNFGTNSEIRINAHINTAE